ncbi:hypothetical protein Tco_0508304 [Tanacetum coccineum]
MKLGDHTNDFNKLILDLANIDIEIEDEDQGVEEKNLKKKYKETCDRLYEGEEGHMKKNCSMKKSSGYVREGKHDYDSDSSDDEGPNTRSDGLWSSGLDLKNKGANRDQHIRDQRARSGDLWSGGLDPKRGVNREQHSRDQRGCWLFEAWGIIVIPHRLSMRLVYGL